MSWGIFFLKVELLIPIELMVHIHRQNNEFGDKEHFHHIGFDDTSSN